MTRIIENLIGGSNLHNLSGIHDRHTVSHTGHRAKIMSYKHNGCTKFFLNITKQVQNLRLYSHIQRCGRLIRKDNFRISGQCHRQHGTLPHAAGKLVRILAAALCSVVNPHQFHEFFHPVLNLCPGQFLFPRQFLFPASILLLRA